ncbi:MAG: hypothetical protein K2G63_05295 [Oscillospiraceae bacterium]|nr:hypothetical protein [Oscillospiraceae bacterium]
MAEYFGIRHFSPACAFYLTEFLRRLNPEYVLIEGPSDLNNLIEPLCSPKAVMPAAILAYTTEPPIKTVLWPFAEFSPEYQAMMWAIDNNVPVKFCDLPSSCVLAQMVKEAEETENPEKDEENLQDKKISVYEQIENISGLDNDSLWEYSFEQSENYQDFLNAVEEYGKSIREFSESDENNSLREAFMRRIINDTEQIVPSDKIAVITGAFHTMGIKNIPFSKEDKKLTDKLPKADFKSTLMPYSYYRLSSRSGYGAGSKAPAYYEILWDNRLKNTLEDSSAEYFARIAEYQRNHGFPTSSAEVIEALRLSKTLAEMRGGKFANLADLKDSATTCLGHGSFSEISLACADTEIGTKIGTLPEGTVCTSVQEDFIRQLKDLKLERYRTPQAEELELDLRENLRVKSEKSAFLGLNRSFFLHRLKVLGIHFCEQQMRYQENATWAELWTLRWTPEVEIEIVEASLKGDTVKQASQIKLSEKLISSENLAETAEILSEVFLCGLDDTVKSAVSAVQKLAVGCSSAIDTGNTIGTLSGIIRFGSIRKISVEPIISIVQQLFLRFCLNINDASICDNKASESVVSSLSKVNDACLSHDFLNMESFIKILFEIAENDNANPLVSGFACALLMEHGKIDADKLSTLINRKLSKGTPPAEGASWFEGLSKRNRRSLINRLSIWEKLCNFITELDDEEFKPVLICLRRTFAEFSASEKSEIAENIGEVMGISAESASEFVNSQLSEDEQQMISDIDLNDIDLDDFDFGDI